MSDSNGIEVDGLVRVFKKGPRAVDGIDLEVAPGEIYGFLGPNGAGKSTTVLMLTTLLPPTEGSARVAGFDVVKQGADVRRSIGAALQEAALDPFLTGREHMRLQGGLHGLGKAEREKRGNELLERVGLIEAADRKVGGYSGGMKRRLDLGLALVHRPRILFLDEPTTGLDPQSRSALWEEVGRLSADDGVTVFLTTQYLEEADVLADRVGIIDHGKIVAEGTPAQLKAEIGRSSIEAVPADDGDRARLEETLERFGERTAASPKGVAVRFGNGADITDVVRAWRSSPCTSRRSTTSSSPRPAARSRAPARTRRGRPPRRAPCGRRRLERAGQHRTARAPLGDAHPAPAGDDRVLVRVPDAAARGERRRARRRHPDSRLPGRLLPHVRARGAVRAGRPVRVEQRGHELRRGHRERLPRAAVAHAAHAHRAPGRPARGRRRARAGAGGGVPGGGRGGRRRLRGGAGGRPGAARAVGADHPRVRHAGGAGGAAVGLRRGRAGALPALLRRPVPVVDGAAARPDRAGLVPHDRDLQPGLVPARGDPLASDHGLGRRGAGGAIAVVGTVLSARALRGRMVRT
jgi:ABC-2 type transport system ATP-binding protein